MKKKLKIMPASGNKRLVFFGNERIATGISTSADHLRMLVAEGYEIAAVVTKQDSRRSRNERILEIKELADSYQIPVLQPEKLSDIRDILNDLRADAAILVAYGKIISEDIIELFPHGIINVHPSLLPLHRGPTPLESVILNGESETGVSIMALAKEMDAGPVYAQSTVPLTGYESKQELADILTDVSVAMLKEVLPGILSGDIIPIPQDTTKATYDQLLLKSDGTIDWTQPAHLIERQIRAYAGWPKSTAEIAGKYIEILEAEEVSNTYSTPGQVKIIDGKLIVACGEHSIEIQKLKPAGKSAMDAVSFIQGYKDKL